MKNSRSTEKIGFEVKFWLAADKMRDNMGAANTRTLSCLTSGAVWSS
ncbi:hypothetical protein [Nitrosospira briensis]|nr:hypothetical protein [Nitrosospira briensis]